MPYASVNDLPDQVKDNLPKDKWAQWMQVFNSVYADAVEKHEKDPDIHAFKAAWSVTKKAEEGLISEADESSGHWITTDTGQHVFISDTLSGRGFKLKDIGGVKVEKNSSNLPKDAVAGYEPKTKTIYTTPDATPEDVDHEVAHHIASEVYADPKHIPSVEKLFDDEKFASSVDKLGGFDTEYGKGNTGELWADTFSAMKNNPAEMEKLVSKNPELKKLTDIIQKDSGYSFEDFKKAKGSKSEGIFIYENDLEPGQKWITLPGGQHILVGPGAPSGLKRTPSTPEEPKPQTRAEYKRKKAAEYRAKAKAAKLGTDEPVHDVGDHTEASHKGTKFKFGGDVNPGAQEEIYKSYSKEIDSMSPAQRAGFSNIEVTTETDEWSTDGSRGVSGASYSESESKITLYDANAIGPGKARQSAHYYLAHESGHGVWAQSEDVAWGNAMMGRAPNDDVDAARISFMDATREEGRITGYADAWYKSNPGRGRDENFAESTKLFTDPDSKQYYIEKHPKTYESWKNLMNLMDKEAEKP